MQFNFALPEPPINFSAKLQNVNVNPNLPFSISPVMDAFWNADWEVQTLKDRAFIVSNPSYDITNHSPSVLKLNINYTDDFTGLANGKPRAELQRRNFYFEYGKEYSYSFKNYIDSNFVFDLPGASNANILTQIKQTGAGGGGSPPRCLGHNGNQYYVDNYIYLPGGSQFSRTLFGDASLDRDKWVKWKIEFKVDSLSGTGHGYYKVFKDDVLVYSDSERTWAYTINPEFYMKVGVYKYDWHNYYSLQNQITIYIDDIILENLTDNIITSLTDFHSDGDSISHIINLTWTNPVGEGQDSTIIYSSLINDTNTALKIGTVAKNQIFYHNTLGEETVRYYWLKTKYANGSVSAFSSVAVDTTSFYASN